MQKVFDGHFHLLFKHYIGSNNKIGENIRLTGLGQTLDEIFGGPFDSQSSPELVSRSPLSVGVCSLIALEHAFANRILTVKGINIGKLILPLDWKKVEKIKNSKTTYYDDFLDQVNFYLQSKTQLGKAPYHIHFTGRGDAWHKLLDTEATYQKLLAENTKRYLVFSIEGGHNLSNVPIKSKDLESQNPELQLKALQERNDVDFMSINLCHLSDISEQRLGGFSQGLNKSAQIAFFSEDFFPKVEFGLTERGKKVIRQALLHEERPVLIDVKHMSVYTRFHFYAYRSVLAEENAAVDRLPIVSTHTGFVFTSLRNFLKDKPYRLGKDDTHGYRELVTENRKIGRTNDKRNHELYANPWTINLFDEEIVEIMQSKGIIGISLDQRILGHAKSFKDGKRPKDFEPELVAKLEAEKLFEKGELPFAAEGFFEDIFKAPTRAERHIMLFCMHLVYAVRVGQEGLPWLDGTSPWDHLCIGSDYDGLINPINGYDNITEIGKMAKDLKTYLPLADFFLDGEGKKSLLYLENGKVDPTFLDEVIEKVMFTNGVRLVARFLKNWQE
jgi:microsomal dipeptidase-like Zn-dependent dipeptidase